MSKTVPTVNVRDGVTYQHHPHHRDKNPQKSQWIISQSEEMIAFEFSLDEALLDDGVGWGIHLVKSTVERLGTLAGGVNFSRLAKFVDGTGKNCWHGYPADYRGNSHDIPTESVLKVMLEKKLFDVATLARLSTGKPCKALS